jgi:hypothetical protein
MGLDFVDPFNGDTFPTNWKIHQCPSICSYELISFPVPWRQPIQLFGMFHCNWWVQQQLLLPSAQSHEAFEGDELAYPRACVVLHEHEQLQVEFQSFEWNQSC